MTVEGVRIGFSAEQAVAVATELGIDFDVTPFDLEQFRRGMEVELEHGRRDPITDVTHDDPIVTGKIAWAHLREMPDYYDRLDAMEREAEGDR
ncbi:MAG TPA: DUF5661 family protein [Actinomycetota bacterium]|jgi:hypothetical protein